MKSYEIIIDYVTTCTIIVNARNEESAENKALDYVQSQKGFRNYLDHAIDNRNGGFEIPQDATEWSDESLTYYKNGKGLLDLRKSTD